MRYAILEVSLHLWGEANYSVNFRFTQSEADVDQGEEIVGLPLTNLRKERYLPLLFDSESYGRLLGESLFASPKARDILQIALTTARARGVRLQIQLALSPSMPYLHDLRWETLRDPVTNSALFLQDDILFSRRLSSPDSRLVRSRSRADLGVLAVIASPKNLEGRFKLPPIDVDQELERVTEGLDGLRISRLTSKDGPVSLDNILERLKAEPGLEYDILYLVCHGALVKEEPRLWLEDENQDVSVVSGIELASRLMEISARPRLVMLVSCQSAGRGDDASRNPEGALVALGPRLIQRAGIPAVIAMQGRVSMQTMKEFLPAFFSSLRRNGQIDLAMTLGRAAIREREEAWMPVLFMRTNRVQLWAESDSDRFHSWDALLNQLKSGQCTPILGSGLIDHIRGSRREIAQRWAEIYRYPMASQDTEDFPTVAQFLATRMGREGASNELRAYLHRHLYRRFCADIPSLRQDGGLKELFAEIGRWHRQRSEEEPHRVLARLGCPVYITTNPDRLLFDALQEIGVEPVEGVFDWQNRGLPVDPRLSEDSDYWPEPAKPLVYYLFGRFSQPGLAKLARESYVMTQDDYFEYLAAATRDKKFIPPAVSQAMTDSALLFIGFRLTDWDFRVLFQSIRERAGRIRLGGYMHVAVQLTPEEGAIQDAEMARRYIEKLSSIDMGQIDIFWGSIPSFMQKLVERLKLDRRY